MNIFFNQSEARLRAGWRLLLQLVLMIIISGGLIVILSLAGDISGRLWRTFCMTAGAVTSVLLAARWFDRRSAKGYGLILTKISLRDGLTGFCLGGIAMAFIFSTEYAVGALKITGYGWQQTLQNESFIIWLALYFIFMILVGFYEELLSRGYQIVNLSEGLNTFRLTRKRAVLGSVVLSSVVFGLLHATNPGAGWLSTLNVALAGGMLAFPFVITGRLSFSIGLHVGWNFFQGGIFGFPVSGLAARSSLIKIHQAGAPVFTGGHFGPEAGLMGLAGMALVIILTTWYFKRVGQPLAINSKLGIYEAEPSKGADNLPEQSL